MSSPKPVIILGAGADRADIAEALDAVNRSGSRPGFELVGFLDDNPELWGAHKVLGPLEKARDYPDAFFINGIGSARNHWRRPELVESLAIPPERWANVVHPRANLGSGARLGHGCVLLAGAVVSPTARLGNHVMLMHHATVSHDCRLDDHVYCAPGAFLGGRVQVGQASYLGARCAVREDLTLGAGCCVGLGAVVLQEVAPHTVVVGNPARPLRATGGVPS